VQNQGEGHLTNASKGLIHGGQGKGLSGAKGGGVSKKEAASQHTGGGAAKSQDRGGQ